MNHHNNNNLCLVTSYFNPTNSIVRFVNFVRFYNEITQYKNITVIVVESISSESKYTLCNIVKTNLISIHTNEVYWKKECLLNIGIKEALNKKEKYIAWVDCDIEFKNKDWVSKTINKLKTSEAVQLFSEVEIDNGYSHENTFKKSILSAYIKENKSIDVILNRRGEIGFGYAYRSSFIKKHFLYNFAVVGAGDYLNLIGLVNISDEQLKQDRYFRKNTSNVLNHYLDWYNKIETPNSISCVENKIKTYFHGNRKNRNYLKREEQLGYMQYNPFNDILVNKSHTHIIKNKQLKTFLKNYFTQRKEEYFTESKLYNKRFKNLLRSILIKKNIKCEMGENPFNKLSYITNRFNETDDLKIKHKKDQICVWHSSSSQKIMSEKLNDVESFVFLKEKTNLSDTQFYLKLIIENYNNLPKFIFFLNDQANNENSINELNKIIKHLEKSTDIKTDFILKRKTKLLINESGYISNLKQDIDYIFTPFTEWVGLYLNKDITELNSMICYQDNIFYTSRECIIQNKKEYYENLLNTTLKNKINENEFYISKTWNLILK